MKLRKPCEHGRYEAHPFKSDGLKVWPVGASCPGGEFLADDARLIHGAIRAWNPDLNDYAVRKCAEEILDALTVREGTE